MRPKQGCEQESATSGLFLYSDAARSVTGGRDKDTSMNRNQNHNHWRYHKGGYQPVLCRMGEIDEAYGLRSSGVYGGDEAAARLEPDEVLVLSEWAEDAARDPADYAL